MPLALAFAEVATLLSRLEDIEYRDPPCISAAEKNAQLKVITESWFQSHNRHLIELDADGAVALLSALLPERRPDRVYGIQAASLCRILSRSLGLSARHVKDLQAHKHTGGPDLATCVEKVLKSGGPPAIPPVSLDEVDEMLQILAGHSRFSGPSVPKLPPGSSEIRDNTVGNIFKRLQPSEGKWLVRLILKDFSPVCVNEALVLRSFHFLLASLLRFQNDLQAAIGLLRNQLQEYPHNPDPRSQRLLRQSVAKMLKPVIGVKVGRPIFHKARGVDHCMKMLDGQPWILERKYDGEYCEIHIDMSRSCRAIDCIKIFSKSGKDSTTDRRGLHQTLVDCLHLGKRTSKVKRQAIFLGELVVYSENEHCILPFEKIRKHVSRSGRSIGTDEDSQPHSYEHLAIVFFDVLLLDNEVTMVKPIEERRLRLREAYTKIPGRAMSAEWKIVDFSVEKSAKKALIEQFAASIAERCEGLILKPSGLPYFCLDPDDSDRFHRYIKLKKDYIAEMGDEADFAVIGASYDGQLALKSGVPGIKWTNFHLGCLLNKADVLRFDSRPLFKVVGTVRCDSCIPRPILQAANRVGQISCSTFSPRSSPKHFDVGSVGPLRIDVTFDTPFVWEVLGSGFEKPSNSNFLMLRHARVKKMHEDRTWKDCISFQELQEQAEASRAAPPDSESQETRRQIQRLELKCKRKLERERTRTPQSTTTVSPGSATTLRSCRSKRKNSGKKSLLAAHKTLSGDAEVTSSALDGTTLIGTSSAPKRKREEGTATPCPPAKRLRADNLPGSRGRPLTSSPLSDITNSAPRPITAIGVTRRDVHKAEYKAVVHQVSSPYEQSKANTGDQKRGTPNDAQAHSSCEGSRCLFSNAVIYLSPCISTTAYITEDLLCTHHAVRVTELQCWDRDAFAHASLTETVSESQAYIGMKKIVLVESKRKSASKAAVNQVLALNRSRFRERVEVYDWRVLENYTHHGIGAVESSEYFLGATRLDEDGKKAVFMAGRFANWLAV